MSARDIVKKDTADFTPTLGNYTDLQPFRFWCQKVLPLVYDDSLSYYELLCKVVDYLNKTMEDVGVLEGDVTKLHEAYKKLQEYVNTYFSTLDVQEEINNKLDAMAKDGSLTELIKKYVDPFIKEQNNKIDVLENRMNTFTKLPDGSTTADAELIDIRVPASGFNNNNPYDTAGDSVRGQTGLLSKITIHKSNITYPYDGYISKGVLTEAAQFKTSDYIVVHKSVFAYGKLYNLGKGYYYINCYDRNKNFLGGLLEGDSETPRVKKVEEKIELLSNTYYIRVTTAANKTEEFSIYHWLTDTLDEVNDLSAYMRKIDLQFIYDGYISNDDIISSTLFKTTDYISVTNAILACGVLYNLDNKHYYINCYDQNKKYLGGLLQGTTETPRRLSVYEKISLIKNTYYIKVTTGQNYTQSISMYYCLTDTLDEFNVLNQLNNTIAYYNDYNTYKSSLGFSVFSKFASIGDSLSVGYYTNSSGVQVSKDLTHSWENYIEKRTGSKAFWTGISGATCKSWLESPSEEWGLKYCRKIGTMPLYVICMGANEGSFTIGSETDIGADNNTLYSYVSKVITELRKISPNSFIVCTGVARKQNSTNINNVYKTICEKTEKCFYLDCEHEFNSAPLSEYYFNYHYSANGYSMIASLFNNKLSDVMSHNIDTFKYINEADI